MLCECLGKGKQSLCYVYEEYEVNYAIKCISCSSFKNYVGHLQHNNSEACSIPHDNTALMTFIPNLLHQYGMVLIVEIVCSKPLTQPRIAALIGEEETQYLIICEKSILFKVATIKLAIFFTVAAYYCFNLEYPTPAKNVFNFLQDYILAQPDLNKKSASYLAVVSYVIFLTKFL